MSSWLIDKWRRGDDMGTMRRTTTRWWTRTLMMEDHQYQMEWLLSLTFIPLTNTCPLHRSSVSWPDTHSFDLQSSSLSSSIYSIHPSSTVPQTPITWEGTAGTCCACGESTTIEEGEVDWSERREGLGGNLREAMMNHARNLEKKHNVDNGRQNKSLELTSTMDSLEVRDVSLMAIRGICSTFGVAHRRELQEQSF